METLSPRTSGRHAALFVDEDHTLLQHATDPVDPRQLTLMPGAADVLSRFHQRGYRIVVVSNQPGIARGDFPEEALAPVRRRLARLLAECGAALDGFHYCPHDPRGRERLYAHLCGCRKPAPGMLFRAARELGISLQRSWMVGDTLDDIEAGARGGCRTALLDVGTEAEWAFTPYRVPHVAGADWLELEWRILTATSSPVWAA